MNGKTPENIHLHHAGSASELKLAQRLKAKRLYEHLEDSIILKTVTSDIKSNDELSQSGTSKVQRKNIPGSRYREVRRSQERNKLSGIMSRKEGKLEFTDINSKNIDISLQSQNIPSISISKSYVPRQYFGKQRFSKNEVVKSKIFDK